jgi:hypothetical protein
MGSSPITRSNSVTKGRVSSTVERLSYKQATRVRLLHPAPIDHPGIAQLAEHAIDNRETVGSIPTPWTNLQAGVAKWKGTRLPTWHFVGSNPTARSITVQPVRCNQVPL